MHKMSSAIKVSAVIMVLFLAIFGVSSAFAVEDAEYGVKYKVDDDASMVDVDIIDFKVRLYELGFYSAGVSDATLQTRELDDLTMAAVKLVCKMNPDITYYNDGVSNTLYWRVMGEVPGDLQTPLDEMYHDILPGETGDNVTNIQNRLNQLNYNEAGLEFTPGVYDENLQGAINEFVRCNKFVYEGDAAITVEMQELLFSDAAVAFSPEAVVHEKVKLEDRILAYLRSSNTVAGFTLPNVAILAIGFVLVCVIVILVFSIVSPGKTGEEKRRQNKKSKKSKAKSGEIEFEIVYGDNVCTYRSNVMKDYVRIGRATGKFPLNMSDESVSRKHCEICYEGGTLMLRDFSTYGTFINGSKCHHSQQALQSGDVIEVGKHRITIHFQK